jgi:hypothetical protein
MLRAAGRVLPESGVGRNRGHCVRLQRPGSRKVSRAERGGVRHIRRFDEVQLFKLSYAPQSRCINFSKIETVFTLPLFKDPFEKMYRLLIIEDADLVLAVHPHFLAPLELRKKDRRTKYVRRTVAEATAALVAQMTAAGYTRCVGDMYVTTDHFSTMLKNLASGKRAQG